MSIKKTHTHTHTPVHPPYMYPDGVSPTFTEGVGGRGSNLPMGSTESMRSRTFLENAIRWRPIIKKYRALRDGGAGGGKGGAEEDGAGGAGGAPVNPLQQQGEGAPGSAATRGSSSADDRRESRVA